MAKPELGRDRPVGLRRLGADRRRDRQVPRRPPQAPRRLRRAEAQQRRRRGARAPGRPEGRCRPARTSSTTSPTSGARPRSSSRGSWSCAAPTSARWTRTPCSSSSPSCSTSPRTPAATSGRSRSRTTTTTGDGSSQNNGLVRFVVDDFDKLQEEAYEKAIADARARAERLARLSKVELGPIVAVREIVVPGDGPERRTTPVLLPAAQRRRRPAAQAAGDVQVPGDPGPRRVAGALRRPLQGRAEGEDRRAMSDPIPPAGAESRRG